MLATVFWSQIRKVARQLPNDLSHVRHSLGLSFL
jgi:hypothetical protein